LAIGFALFFFVARLVRATELCNFLASARASRFARLTAFLASLKCRRATLAACFASFADFFASCQRSRARSTALCNALEDFRAARFARVFTMFSPLRRLSFEHSRSQQTPPEQDGERCRRSLDRERDLDALIREIEMLPC
jgi:hypothetical protein